MRLAIISILLVLFSAKLIAQDQLYDKALLDSVIHYGKTVSIFKDSIDWEVTEHQMHQVFEDEGLIEASKFMLKALKDYHGAIWLDNQRFNDYKKPYQPTTLELSDSLLNLYKNSSIPIYGEVIDSKYGYIHIPGIQSSNEDSIKARKIFNLIKNQQNEYAIKGWIIDLRLNGGGTMFPMLAGLSPFLSDNNVGSFAYKGLKENEPWNLQQGDVYFGQNKITDYELPLSENLSLLGNIPVVVLISAGTVSSGEVTAIAFKNRPNTLFIGEDTGGYTTANSSHVISDSITLQLSAAYFADRVGTIYAGDSVQPDTYTEGGDNFETLLDDEKVKSAIRWIDINFN